MNPERAAESLLKELGVDAPAVDVADVAQELGIRVERTDLGDDCSGVLVRRGNAAVIGVHFGHSPYRQRFTIAHEIAHYRLHSGDKYVDRGMVHFRDSASGTGTIVEEREANRFAAALLMPAAWVAKEFQEHPFDLGDDAALSALCQRFGVSVQAMTYRLTNLGLLSDSPKVRRR